VGKAMNIEIKIIYNNSAYDVYLDGEYFWTYKDVQEALRIVSTLYSHFEKYT
jgi:hypothetical protein